MQICPRVFDLDDNEGKAILIGAEYAKDELKLVKEAIDNCPIGCITE
jgi:ferredoxin